MLNNQSVMEIGGKIIINNNRNQHDRRRDADDSNLWNSDDSSVCRFGDVTAPIFDQSHQQQHNHHHLQRDHFNSYQNLRSEPPSSSHVMCLKLGKRNYFEDISSIAFDRQQQQQEEEVAATHFNYTSERSRSLYPNDSNGSGTGGGGWETNSSSLLVTDAEVEAMMMLNNGVLQTGALMVRCQVEGCNVALGNAKEYHRRHKVCEMHSKAPKVVVFGLQQRFCQQCSRFHEMSEFDDTKRSCRRRLAGHNERRRKSPRDTLLKNSPSQVNKIATGRQSSYSPSSSPTDHALSLLSPKRDHHLHHNHPYITPPDLSSRSSAALRELIAENRAAVLSNQLLVVQDTDLHWHELNNAQSNHGSSAFLSRLQPHQIYNEQLGLDRYRQDGGAHVTLDLMQAPRSAFGCLSVRGKKLKPEEAEQCSDELWNSVEDEG